MLFLNLRPSILPVVLAQSDEKHANRTASVLEWYDRYRGSNEEEASEKEKIKVILT